MTPGSALERGLRELGLDLPVQAPGMLLRYQHLLEKWNRTYNLTAIRDPVEVIINHVLDSLAVIPQLPAPVDGSLADVGSGGGTPGIPLAIARPEWRITLNDASEKKAAFLRQAIIELQLTNVRVHEGRAEAWKPQPRFATVISRAFSQLAEFLRTCRHLVAPNGYLAAMKGLYPQAELDSLPPDFRCRVVPVKVPMLHAERHLVLCQLAN